MNFTRVLTGFSRSFCVLFLGASLLAFSGCKPAASDAVASGDLAVQIPLTETQNGENGYALKTVVLQNVDTLRELRGKYAQFFYAPGMNDGRLSGGSPVAYFAKTKNNTYIAKDTLSLQMATLYYHMQSLITWAQDLGITVKGPFQIGLNTKIKGDEAIQANNAFYDGRSKAMLFVPYTAKEMPIAVNAGIVAHEFFHSIFYRKVLEPLGQKRLSVSQQLSDQNVHSLEGWSERLTVRENLSDVELFNETYLRGVNEGLADFWGWAYTDDPDFLKWSLSTHVKKRSLTKPAKVIYKSEREIESAVLEAQRVSDDPSMALSNFIYEVGTPYARFLKELVTVKVQNNGLTRADAKREVSQIVLRFVEDLGRDAVALGKAEKLSPQALFLAVAGYDNGRQSQEQCDLLVEHLNSPLEKDGVIAAKYSCEKEENLNSYKVVAP